MNSQTLCLFDKMINITKTVSCFVIRTAQQINNNMMHPSEKFRHNLLVKFYFIKDFIFLIHELKQGTILVWALCAEHRKVQILPCALEAVRRKGFCF